MIIERFKLTIKTIKIQQLNSAAAMFKRMMIFQIGLEKNSLFIRK